MLRRTRSALVVGIWALGSPARAAADDALGGPRGMGVTAGAGVASFADRGAREFVDPGALWEARLVFAPRETYSVEGAYVGSLHGIEALGLDDDAALLGTGIELNVKVSFLDGAVRPYALLGAGWTRYSLVRSPPTADLEDRDDVLSVPLGAGLTFWAERWMVDLRGTYRATSHGDLFAPSAEDVTLDTWSATLRVGYAL